MNKDKLIISRRKIVTGLASTGGLLLAGCIVVLGQSEDPLAHRLRLIRAQQSAAMGRGQREGLLQERDRPD